MGIWKATSIKETPKIELIGFKIYEVSSPFWEGRTRHFSGFNITEFEGRASSAIVEFDKEKMVGKTGSGRLYKLSNNKPRLSQARDAYYVWQYFIITNQLFDIVDVTEEYKDKDE